MDVAALLQQLAQAEARRDPAAAEAARGRLRQAVEDDLPADPLLAAACLHHLAATGLDPDLSARLAARAAQAAPRTASAAALVVDVQGQGQVVEVVVALSPGGQGAWTPQAIERDAAVAAQLAVAVALGAEASRWGVRWQVRAAPDVALRGTSIGLAIAVATRAALQQQGVPPGHAFTGGVDLDGALAPVSALPAKVRAAAAHPDIHTAILPAAGRALPRPPEGVTVARFASLEAVWAALSPAQTTPPSGAWTSRWRGGARWLLLALLPVVTLLSPADALDGVVQAGLLRVTQAPLPADNVVLLPLPAEGDVRALRAAYPAVLQALAAAGATAVGLDVVMLGETPDDAALAESIAALPIPVVLASRWEASTRFLDPVIAAGERATVQIERDGLLGWARRVPVRLRVPGAARWHMAVALLAAHLDAPPRMEGRTLAVGVTRNPTRLETVLLPPTAPHPRLSWTDRSDWPAQVAGRVVLIGSLSDRRDRLRTPYGTRFGVEIHAAMIEALARQAAPREAPAEQDALFSLLAALGGAGLAHILGPRRWWRAAALGVAVALIVLVALATARVLLAPVPLLGGVLLGAWLVSRRPPQAAA